MNFATSFSSKWHEKYSKRHSSKNETNKINYVKEKRRRLIKCVLLVGEINVY